AVNTSHRQHQCQRRKHRKQHRVEALRRRLARQNVVKRRDLCDRQVFINRLHRARYRRNQGLWISVRANRQHHVVLWPPSYWRVYPDQWFRLRSVSPDFRYHTNHVVVEGAVVRDVLADSVSIGPETPREVLVDQENRLALFLFVASERAASQNRNSHRLEIICTDDGPIDIDQLAFL